MAQRSAQIVTTLKVSNLKTYETLAIGFDVEVWTSTTPTVAGGNKDTLFASRFIGGSKYGILFKSSDHLFTGLVKENYYIARYRIVRVDGIVSTWYEEEELIGDTNYENPGGSPAVSITSKSIVSSNGAIVAQFTIDNIPSDHKEVHWYVRPSTDNITKTTIPEHITTDIDIVSGDGTAELRIPILGNKYIYAIPVDASRNKFLTGGYAAEIGTVAALTVPSAPTLTYADGIIKALTSYNFTNDPDVTKLEFNLSRDGGSTWVVHEVFRPDDASGATNIDREIFAEGGITFTWRVRAVNSIGMVTTYSSNASIVCPFANAAIDDGTTALIPFNKGVGSTDGLYPSNSPQVVMRNDGRYGGCVEISEIPSDVLEWTSQANLIEDYNMEGGLDKWKAWGLSYNAGTDVATVTDNADIDLSNMTFIARVYFEDNSVTHGIAGKWQGTSQASWFFNRNTDRTISLGVSSDGVDSGGTRTDLTTTDTIADKDWAYVAFTYDGTDIKIYINGLESATVAHSGGIFSSTTNLFIGRGGNNTNSLKGLLSETRLFNRGLSAAEVLYYSKGYPTKPIDKGASQTAITAGSFIVEESYRILTIGTTDFTLIGASSNTVGVEFTATGVGSGTGTANQIGEVAHWDFQEGAGQYLIDKSGNGLIATITGATWVTDSELAKSGLQAYRGNQSLKLANSRTNFEIDLTPKVIGSDLVSNGAFTTDTTGWTASDSTIASVAGGQAGNCLEITRVGSTVQQVSQTLAMTVGNRYRITFYVKSGTSGDEAWNAYIITSINALTLSGTTSNTWTKVTAEFTAKEASAAIKLRKATATAGTMLFDTVSVVEVEYQSAFLYSQMAYLPTRGSDLVTNGGFATDTTGWTVVDATLSSIAGGESGNCCEIAWSVDTQTTYQNITGLTVGNWYRAEIYIKDGVQTGLVNTFAIGTTIGGTETKSLSVTTNAVWTKYSLVFEATATSHYINYNTILTTPSSNTTLFDSVTLYQINMLDIGIEGYQVLKGTANSDLVDSLFDNTLNQFKDVAIGDWVHNTTDDTWAQVTANMDDWELTLNWDAFPDGDEEYELFVLAKSSGYVSHFSQDGNGEWGNKSMQIVSGQYDNRLVVTVSKNLNDQSESSFLDFTHLLKQNDDGLVGHWKLSRRDGARDLSGNGYHGTIQGNPVYAEDNKGVVDGALDMDGTGDYIKVDYAIGNLGSTASFSIWFYNNTGNNYLVDFRGDAGGGAGYIYLSSGGTVLTHSTGTPYVNGVQTATVPTNTWVLVVVTGMTVNINEDMRLGARYDDTQLFTSRLEDARLSNRTLSAAEVLSLYDGTKELYTSNSIEYLKQGGVPVQLNSDFDKDERVIKYSTNGIINLSAISINFDIKLLKYVSTGYFVNHDDADNRILLYQKNSDGSLYIRLGSGAEADSGFNLILDKFYKIALILDGTNYTLIVDGTVESTNTYTGLDSIVPLFNIGADASAINNGECLIENFRIDKVAKTEEQIRAFHELQVPFFDPDPNTSPAPVISFSNVENVYSVSPKDNLQQQGTVKITNGSATIQGIGTEFTKMFQVSEKMQLLGTSAGDVVYTVQSITDDDTLVLTAVIAEVTAAGLDYKNYTWKNITDTVEPLKFIKKVKKFS